MKKTLLLAFASIAFLFSSCDKEKDEVPTTENPTPTEEVSKLYKKWTCTSVAMEGTGNITGAPMGSFTATGFDHTDFGIEFLESSKSVIKDGNYSLDLKLNTTKIPVTNFKLDDQVIFPTGNIVENADGTVTVKSTPEDVKMSVLKNTDTELILKMSLNLSYDIPGLSSTLSLPSQATFSFKSN
jgi:hypothetical protein